MKGIVRLLTVLLSLFLASGCAHKYSDEDFRNLDLKVRQGEEENKRIASDDEKLKVQIEALTKDLKNARDEKAECLRDKQTYLDRTIDTLEQNKALLQQMSRFKTIMQERKDMQSRLNKIYEYAMNLLKDERLADQLYIVKNDDRIKIIIPQRVLFAGPKSAWVTPKGIKIIEKTAKGLRSLDTGFIEVGGHTDNAVLQENARKVYANNWFLADARAIAVVELLETGGIKKDRLCAISYADTRPIADNTSEEGMSMNRRVEISIQP